MHKCDSLNIFEELSRIPRPSGKEEKVVEYLVEFARKYGLEYKLCGTNNVIIYKNSTIKGNKKTIIMQGHIDMVCEKEITSSIDFDNDPIELIYEGDFVRANGTTLGSDNGFGVAVILHVLKSKDLKHPNIEAVFTSEEETTMGGAKSLDYSLLKGRTILSIDGSEEKKLETASAGMVVVDIDKAIKRRKYDGYGYKVSISNLKGGHSGCDVHLSRSNANKLMVKLLKSLKYPVICDINGGDKNNAIPHSCSVTIIYDDLKLLKEKVKALKEYVIKNNKDDENIVINTKKVRVVSVLTRKDSKNVVKLLDCVKNGVLESNCNHFPVTSQNLAKIVLNESLHIVVSLRSSSIKFENEYVDLLEDSVKRYDATMVISSRAPFFEEKEDSYIVDVCKRTYKELYGEDIESGPVHAGLEGGVFAKYIKDVDICVMAAELYDIHSTTERASVSSLQRVEKWVEKILEEY